MATDVTIAENLEGKPVSFIVRNEDGSLDDLTVYSTVRFIIGKIDYSAGVLVNRTQADAEITVDAAGKLTWTPSTANPGPAFGKYLVQIIREGTGIDKPTTTFTLEALRRAPVA